jgi:hypothetical protein
MYHMSTSPLKWERGKACTYINIIQVVDVKTSMKTILSALALSLLAIGGFAAGNNTELPINAEPRWFELNATASVVPIRSVDTRQTIALLAPGTRFLAFGASDKWVTLAANGQVGYVSNQSVSAVYPEPVFISTEWKPSSVTLEEQLAEEIQRQAQLRQEKVSLWPDFKSAPPTAEELAAQQSTLTGAMMNGPEAGGSMAGAGGGYI